MLQWAVPHQEHGATTPMWVYFNTRIEELLTNDHQYKTKLSKSFPMDHLSFWHHWLPLVPIFSVLVSLLRPLRRSSMLATTPHHHLLNLQQSDLRSQWKLHEHRFIRDDMQRFLGRNLPCTRSQAALPWTCHIHWIFLWPWSFPCRHSLALVHTLTPS